jgi:amino-acid N-acetyltransferase
LAIDPNDIAVVRLNDPVPGQEGLDSLNNSSSADLIRRLPFVTMFRGSANYIANHRGTTAVYHLPGGLLANKTSTSDGNVLRDLMNDIALTWLLGMNIVLVAGCRHQVAQRLGDDGLHTHQGLRVTDAATLRIVKEEAGYVRFEVERQLARALRQQGAGGAAGLGHYDGNVVSGNFYSAQPFGILDGTDYA